MAKEVLEAAVKVAIGNGRGHFGLGCQIERLVEIGRRRQPMGVDIQ